MKANLLKTVFKILSLNLILFSFLNCSQSSKYKENILVDNTDINTTYESVEAAPNDLHLKDNTIITSSIPKNLKIIKSASAKYKVKNVKEATNKMKQMALKYSAYISDLRFENNLYRKENRFTIKIPEQFFDSMMDSISNYVEFIDYENITTRDVTEEYIDLQTRLKTKLEVKGRYEIGLKLLKIF